MNDELLARVGNEMVRVGGRLRRMRKERGWRLEDLSARSGLSKPYLSRLEGGGSQPSLAALFAVAGAYGVPFSWLFEPEPGAEEGIVVRAADTRLRRGNGLSYAPLSAGRPGARMQPLRVVVPAGREGEELYRHEGEEWLHVLSGRLLLRLGEAEHELGPGDSAYFDASEPHRLEALGEDDAEVVLVAAAVASPLLRSYL